MKNKTTRRICLTALMAAIIYVFTAYIHVPSHTGYTHVGDGFLYLAASLLPAPYAAAAGAIGAGLADLLSGYSIWAPGTIIIKALTAFCFTNKLDKLVNKRNILGIVPAMLPAIALGVAAVRLHTFTGYSGVLLFAVPYAAVYAAGLYRFAMDESEKDMVRSVVRKIRR